MVLYKTAPRAFSFWISSGVRPSEVRTSVVCSPIPGGILGSAFSIPSMFRGFLIVFRPGAISVKISCACGSCGDFDCRRHRAPDQIVFFENDRPFVQIARGHGFVDSLRPVRRSFPGGLSLLRSVDRHAALRTRALGRDDASRARVRGDRRTCGGRRARHNDSLADKWRFSGPFGQEMRSAEGGLDRTAVRPDAVRHQRREYARASAGDLALIKGHHDRREQT